VGITGSVSDFNAALTGDDFSTLGGNEIVTGNKTHTGEIKVDELIFPSASTPITPAAGDGIIYSKDIAGRIAPTYRANGFDVGLQESMELNQFVAVFPSNGTAFNYLGMSETVVGTKSHPAIASTNIRTSRRRGLITSSAVAGTSANLRYAANLVWRGNAANLGGFKLQGRISMSTTDANQRLFFGLTSNTGALANADHSTLLNQICLATDSADANLQIMHNDGAGASTKIDLGANFPARNLTTVYEVTFFAEPNGSDVKYRVVNMATGNIATGTISSDLPSSSTFLTWQLNMNNGASAVAVGIEFSRITLQSNL
jgi:hypothetical protein